MGIFSSKKVTMIGLDSDTDNAKLRGGKVSKKADSAGEIPWTPGPQTRWQKFKRSAVG